MKILVATEKPFAKVAVDGIRKEIENWPCWRNIPIRRNCWMR